MHTGFFTKLVNWRLSQIIYINKNHPTHPNHPSTNFFKAISQLKNKDNDMKLSGCDPWGSGLDWTYYKLDLTVEHLLRIALRWGTVLRPGDYYTTLHYITLHYTTPTLHFTTVHYTTL